MYAIVEINGKQYQAVEGKELKVDKIDLEKDKKYDDIKVLLYRDDKDILIGKPFLENVKVKTKIVDTFKDKKVIVFKYKKRKGYHKKQGHRQQYTTLMVDSIEKN